MKTFTTPWKPANPRAWKCDDELNIFIPHSRPRHRARLYGPVGRSLPNPEYARGARRETAGLRTPAHGQDLDPPGGHGRACGSGKHRLPGGLLSTATSQADLASRALTAATRAQGRRWRDVIHDLARRISLRLEVSPNPVTVSPTASLGVGMGRASEAERQETLGRVLDSLDSLCQTRGLPLGLILDEFQEIHRLGGEEAEWHLRGVIQHHAHISYVAAGSRTHLIGRMMGKGAAFYKLFDVLSVGPMAPEFLRDWINEGMEEGGVEHQDMARWILALAGNRTRDVAQLARKTVQLAQEAGRADADTVRQAFLEIIADESEPLRALWGSYAGNEGRVLRAVAFGTDALPDAGIHLPATYPVEM